MRGAVFLPALLQEATGRGMRRVSGVDIPLYTCRFCLLNVKQHQLWDSEAPHPRRRAGVTLPPDLVISHGD